MPETKKQIKKRKLLRALDWQIETHKRFASKSSGQVLANTLFQVECLMEIRKIVEEQPEEVEA